MPNQQPSPRKLSLAIICLDEVNNIERCIRSVPFADEVIVVDSGSTDGTQAVAASCGAKVHEYEWRGFRDQKRLATELCSHDWVLSLDADEALSEEACIEIEKLMKEAGLENFDGYEFPRLTWHLGRWIRHGGWYPDYQLRLYDRRRAQWQGGEHVHECVEAARVQRLGSQILHWPFTDLSEQVATNNRYSSLGAIEQEVRGKRFSLLKLCLKPISKFLETYVLKGGFRDGMAGFVISVGAAYSVFLKFAKLWERERLK